MRLPFAARDEKSPPFIHSLPRKKLLLEMSPYDLTRERSSLREK